jgi:hypothetical protein
MHVQQQQAAQAAAQATTPSAAPDAMQLMFKNLTQSIESLAKKVDGQQTSASREISIHRDSRVLRKTCESRSRELSRVWQTAKSDTLTRWRLPQMSS